MIFRFLNLNWYAFLKRYGSYKKYTSFNIGEFGLSVGQTAFHLLLQHQTIQRPADDEMVLYVNADFKDHLYDHAAIPCKNNAIVSDTFPYVRTKSSCRIKNLYQS